MTRKLYIDDAYMNEFEAKVLKIKGDRVVLDRTAFYSESGGQVGDTGVLNDIRIIDTHYDEKKENIFHIIEEAPDFIEGENVRGKIDWDRRYRIMKLHAASHIMEYFLYKVFGKLRLAGSQVNEKHDASNYEYYETFNQLKLKQVENLTNEFILKGYEIERWEDPNKPGWLYWSAGEIQMPCGGTHPLNTKEIGQILIKRKSGGRGREKVLTSLVE